MFTPRKSVTLEKLRRGETVFCFKSNLSCPRALEIAAMNNRQKRMGVNTAKEFDEKLKNQMNLEPGANG